MARFGALGALGLGLLAGCPDRTISELPPNQTGALTKEIPVSADIDILFVIDNSASTADKQTVFAQNFANFVTALDSDFGGSRPNLHIGVVDTTVDIGTNVFAPGCPSPDPGDNGILQNSARVTGCSPPTDRYISDIANGSGGARTTNYDSSETLSDVLSCIAQVGTSGCGFEAQLQAMKKALDGSHPENANFIRPGAYLAIIFLTDEDDASTKDATVFGLNSASVGGENDFRVQPLFAYKCDQAISATAGGTYTNCKPRTDNNADNYLQSTTYYSQFLATVKDPAQTVVAVIAGPPPNFATNDDPPAYGSDQGSAIVTGDLKIGQTDQPLALKNSCDATINGNPAIGRPAVRLAAFLADFGDRGRFYTICQSDYSAALADIGHTLFNAISPCLEGPVDATDADPNNPGIQPQCTVSDVQNIGLPNQTSTLMPTCSMQSDGVTPVANQSFPCWFITTNATVCPAPDTGLQLNVDRNGVTPPTGTTIDVQCASS